MEKASTPSLDCVTRSGGIDTPDFKTWVCVLCGWVYDEAAGDPLSGLAPGTLWVDVPDLWLCPDCGVGKSEFVMVEV